MIISYISILNLFSNKFRYVSYKPRYKNAILINVNIVAVMSAVKRPKINK